LKPITLHKSTTTKNTTYPQRFEVMEFETHIGTHGCRTSDVLEQLKEFWGVEAKNAANLGTCKINYKTYM